MSGHGRTNCSEYGNIGRKSAVFANGSRASKILEWSLAASIPVMPQVIVHAYLCRAQTELFLVTAYLHGAVLECQNVDIELQLNCHSEVAVLQNFDFWSAYVRRVAYRRRRFSLPTLQEADALWSLLTAKGNLRSWILVCQSRTSYQGVSNGILISLFRYQQDVEFLCPFCRGYKNCYMSISYSRCKRKPYNQ